MQVKNHATPGRLTDVDLRLLRIFRTVADCGGMAAAELELDIAMSTISRHVKDLEQRLGMVLCRRGRSGFSLTPEGMRVYLAADRLLQATEAFRTDLHDIGQQLGGEIHVALFEKIVSNPAAHIDRALARYRSMAPAVEIKLHVGSINTIERGVMDGRFHLGLIPEHRRSASLGYEALFTERMLLFAGARHPWFATPDQGRDCERDGARDWEALKTQDLAGLDYHSPNMALAHAYGLRRTASTSDQEGVAHLVLSGTCLGFLPDHYAEPFVRAGRMRAVCPQVLNYHCRFSVIHRLEPPPLRVAEAFLLCLREAHDSPNLKHG